ncbi:hypothetical protein ABG768_021660, partial [Culter alburnus]
MARKLTYEDILVLIFDSDAESDSYSDRLSDNDEETYRPAIPDNGISASQDTVVDCFLPTWMSDSSSPPDLDFDNITKAFKI